MVHTCVAVGCHNRKNPASGLSFYRFPKDGERRARWTAAVKREHWQPNDTCRLCSAHFISGRCLFTILHLQKAKCFVVWFMAYIYMFILKPLCTLKLLLYFCVFQLVKISLLSRLKIQNDQQASLLKMPQNCQIFIYFVISKSFLYHSYHEFHETCHSVTFIVLVNSHRR